MSESSWSRSHSRTFPGQVIPYSESQAQLGKGTYEGAYVVGGYIDSALDDATVERLTNLELLIVQDIRRSQLTDHADFVFAADRLLSEKGL